MILYHGSYTAVPKPGIAFSRIFLDFGAGFYTTPYKEQAKKWTDRIVSRRGIAYISTYELDDAAFERLHVLEFDNYSKEWLMFVVNCRNGSAAPEEYDIISGSVANDKVFDTIEEYLNGYKTWTETLGRLRYEKPNWQYCFKKQEAMDKHLRFISAEVVK
ncbi:hypothetical protein AGMMS50276_26010 [Synergistales bacterium]|nr:hypothetical protein AGMMS50276_26010 [Synergistales bacterium]